MAERSQIYVKWLGKDTCGLIASHFQWNYAERMISRARYTMEWIIGYKDIGEYPKTLDYKIEHLRRIIDVNFDFKDITFSRDLFADAERRFFKSDQEENDFIFTGVGCDNGKLFIDILPDWTIRYAFTDCDVKTIMTGEEYMDYNSPNWKALDDGTCKKNLLWIDNNANLLTVEELERFITGSYIEPLPFN